MHATSSCCAMPKNNVSAYSTKYDDVESILTLSTHLANTITDNDDCNTDVDNNNLLTCDLCYMSFNFDIPK